MDSGFRENVLGLFRENKWNEILELYDGIDQEDYAEASKLLWVWPSIENLKFIIENVLRFGCSGIISLGCGCGLLEWFLQQYSGLPVLGYEVNREWWESKYSNPLFIEHTYPVQPIQQHDLNSNYALMFCYFNDTFAFNKYVDSYGGNVIVILGPGAGRGTHTEPEPFSPKFEHSSWVLECFQEVRSTADFIAIYIRSV